jgi:protein-disulfide isomerase
MNLQDNNVLTYEWLPGLLSVVCCQWFADSGLPTPGAPRGAIGDNGMVSFRKLVLFLSLTALCLAQGDWQTQTELPGVDWQGLTGAKKAMALKIVRAEACSCGGCDMKVAECRMKDHTCATSKKLANVVAKEVAAGKTEVAIRADLKKIATEPPPVLDDPVKISVVGDPVRGPAGARVTVVEFSDFQCPYCSKAVAATKALMKQFPNDVKLVFKQFPLDDHAQAEFGAEAALAAHAQGKFWEMHDLLYAGYPNLSRAAVMGYAQKIGLDVKRFTAEVDSHKYKAQVDAEEQEGENAGVEGTPTFFINGKKFNDTFDVATVAPLIRNELK